MRDVNYNNCFQASPGDQESVSDDVRDMWKPSCTETVGMPLLLTMPGVQLSADLVCRYCGIQKKM